MQAREGEAALLAEAPRTADLRRARIAVVVPAYNEAPLIARTLQAIPAYVQLVVVVDDASRDDTGRIALALSDPRVVVVRHIVNRGVGAAIVTGYRAAFARGAEVCAVMAGDAQMDPADLWALLAPVLRGEAEYTKGDRLSFPRAREHMPKLRFLGNRTLSWMTKRATGLAICDSQCGYTAISARAAALLPLEKLWPRYGYPNDLLGMLAEHKLSVQEVVVRPIYADEVSGVGFRHALFVIPYVLARVLGRRLLRARSTALSASVELEI
ncbi:MAG: glycosyltransferase family 2 protein [Polyangiales bacterium]